MPRVVISPAGQGKLEGECLLPSMIVPFGLVPGTLVSRYPAQVLSFR